MPTFFRSQPKIYMGAIVDEDLIVGDHLIRYKMRAAESIRLEFARLRLPAEPAICIAERRVFTGNPQLLCPTLRRLCRCSME